MAVGCVRGLKPHTSAKLTFPPPSFNPARSILQCLVIAPWIDHSTISISRKRNLVVLAFIAWHAPPFFTEIITIDGCSPKNRGMKSRLFVINWGRLSHGCHHCHVVVCSR